MPSSRSLRYLAPNLVTATGMLFGMASIVASYEHRFVDAGWLIIWAVLIDRLDGLVARAFHATSQFGVQMDSFADAMNFGVAPAFLVFASLRSVPELGFGVGAGHILLSVACVMWVLANVFRLAKFNVVTEDAPGIFFGVPTTLAAGILVTWYLVLHKYAAAGARLGAPEMFSGPRMLGDWTVAQNAWAYLPVAMLLGAFLMASNLPSPKLARMPSRAVTAVVLAGVTAGYFCGFARYMPDFMALLPTTWLLGSLVWGQSSSRARAFRPPPFLGDEVGSSD